MTARPVRSARAASQRELALRNARDAGEAPVTPPPERAQHGQVLHKPAALHRPTTIASGVQALRRDNAIGDAEVNAADRFQRDYIFGVEGVRDAAVGGRAGSWDAHDAQIARSEALTRHREIADAIGAGMTQWLVGLVVLDLSFTALAERFMRKAGARTEMKGRLTTLLMMVAGLYASIDRRTKPKPT